MESAHVPTACVASPRGVSVITSMKAHRFDLTSQRLELSELPDQLASVLKVFDRDGDGFVDAVELGNGALAYTKAKKQVCTRQNAASTARRAVRGVHSKSGCDGKGRELLSLCFLPLHAAACCALAALARASRFGLHPYDRLTSLRACLTASCVPTPRLTSFKIKCLTRVALFFAFLLAMQLTATCASRSARASLFVRRC